METKISCYKTNQKEPDSTATYAANLAKLNIWNDDLESITDMKDWDKILDQPTIFGTKLTERERKPIQKFLKFSVLDDNSCDICPGQAALFAFLNEKAACKIELFSDISASDPLCGSRALNRFYKYYKQERQEPTRHLLDGLHILQMTENTQEGYEAYVKMFTIKSTVLNDTMRRNGDAPMGEHLLKELFIQGLFQSNPWQVFSRHIDREIKNLTLSNLISEGRAE